MLSQALKNIRKINSMTQEELADKLNITRSYLSEIETGSKEPGLILLRKYSETFEIPLSHLFLFSESIDNTNSLSSKFQSFTSKKILSLLDLANEKLKE